jgi:polyphosphate kinase
MHARVPPPKAPSSDDWTPPLPPGERFFNRELSWLAFNRRVLEEACNEAHPLLERLRFLSISGNNLDEFFMVRVAGLKGQQLLGVVEPSADGLTPGQQLEAIAQESERLAEAQQAVWRELRASFRDTGVTVVAPAISTRMRRLARQAFSRADLPDPDPPGDRSRPPVPVHPEQGLSR